MRRQVVQISQNCNRNYSNVNLSMCLSWAQQVLTDVDRKTGILVEAFTGLWYGVIPGGTIPCVLAQYIWWWLNSNTTDYI